MALGKQVRFYREKLGLTLDLLSERSGVDVGTISALEVRQSTRSKFAPAIAKAFGLSMEQLLDEGRDWLEPATPGKASEIVHLAEPHPRQYIDWPFPDIAPREYFALSPEVRAEVQGFAKALLLRHKNIAAA